MKASSLSREFRRARVEARAARKSGANALASKKAQLFNSRREAEEVLAVYSLKGVHGCNCVSCDGWPEVQAPVKGLLPP